MKDSDHPDIITKEIFIRLVAQEAGFTIGDVRIIWRAVERIFARALISGKELQLGRFGRLFVKDIAPSPPDKPAWDGVHKRRYNRGPSKRVTFRFSQNIKNLLKRDPADYEAGLEEYEQSDK